MSNSNKKSGRLYEIAEQLGFDTSPDPVTLAALIDLRVYAAVKRVLVDGGEPKYAEYAEAVQSLALDAMTHDPPVNVAVDVRAHKLQQCAALTVDPTLLNVLASAIVLNGVQDNIYHDPSVEQEHVEAAKRMLAQTLRELESQWPG